VLIAQDNIRKLKNIKLLRGYKMDKNELWTYWEERLGCENINFRELFNYYSIEELKRFFEFMKDEGF